MNKIKVKYNRYWVRANEHYYTPIFLGEVLISIKHKYAAQIYAGTKRYELRHNAPSFNRNTRLWIYEPKPIGMITGFVDFKDCMIAEPWSIWLNYRTELGVTHEEFANYYNHRKQAFAWLLSDPVKLKEPISLADIGLTRPPQSYQFLNLKPENADLP